MTFMQLPHLLHKAFSRFKMLLFSQWEIIQCNMTFDTFVLSRAYIIH